MLGYCFHNLLLHHLSECNKVERISLQWNELKTIFSFNTGSEVYLNLWFHEMKQTINFFYLLERPEYFMKLLCFAHQTIQSNYGFQTFTKAIYYMIVIWTPFWNRLTYKMFRLISYAFSGVLFHLTNIFPRFKGYIKFVV